MSSVKFPSPVSTLIEEATDHGKIRIDVLTKIGRHEVSRARIFYGTPADADVFAAKFVEKESEAAKDLRERIFGAKKPTPPLRTRHETAMRIAQDISVLNTPESLLKIVPSVADAWMIGSTAAAFVAFGAANDLAESNERVYEIRRSSDDGLELSNELLAVTEGWVPDGELVARFVSDPENARKIFQAFNKE